MAQIDLYGVGEMGGRSHGLLSVRWIRCTHDIETARHSGAMYWNHDQRAMELRTDAEGFSRKEMVRSHDVYPTLDLIWSF